MAGSEARKLLFDFFADCKQDGTAKIDFLAYDLDEPDVIATICGFGRQNVYAPSSTMPAAPCEGIEGSEAAT